MFFDLRAGKRASLLAILMATTSLCPLGASAQDAAQAVTLPVVDVATPLATFYENPTGQTETTIPRENILTNTKAFSTWDALRYSPGVSLKQGNGPRDVGISIRGSNARNGFGIRNIVIFEDGFPVTQPDGLSRGDLIDLHAYSGIDVIRGPSSALFGNYATGGAINFRLRRGAEINGLDVGNEGGSFNYVNNYFAYGSHGENWDSSIFFGNAIGNGPTSYNRFNTQTLNFLISYNPTPNDRFFVKGINNTLYADLSFRLSLNQFYQNPYQGNCYSFGGAGATTAAQGNAARDAAAVAGCQTNRFFLNGFTGTQTSLTAYESGAHRHDRRSILGLRWEHDLDNNTVWRVQAVLDDKNINQPTGATSAIGGEPAFNFISDITSRGTFLGFDATHFVGIFANTESQTSYQYNVKVGGNGAVGALTQVQPSKQTNMGLRGREEVKLTDTLTAVAGLGVEYTKVQGTLQTYSYAISNGFMAQIPGMPVFADNSYYNIAPEGALLWRPNAEWLVRGRVATGYGTPNAGDLFVLPTGLPGNNTQLKTQKNLGFDLGVTYTPWDNVFLDVTGFYEFFSNELVTQSAGPSPLQSFRFNVPRSEHRGVEVAAEWRFLPGWLLRAIYTYNNQIYTDYTEQLTGGTTIYSFNRAGHWIPGVNPNELTLRLGYDVLEGPAKGFGTFAELYLNDSFFIDNGNLLKMPGYQLVNLNFHYDTEFSNSFIQKLGAFFEIRNIFNETYVAGANNLTNPVSATGGGQLPGFSPTCSPTVATSVSCVGGSLYAGFPRTFYGGLKVRF